jgi:rhamnosyltransferase subunit B
MAHRIVFAVWGSLGDLHPYLAVARGLQERGHQCVIATHNFVRSRVEGSGLEFAPMGPHYDFDPELIRKSYHPRRGGEFLLRQLLFPYTRQAFDETMHAIDGADLLVTHPIAYGAQIAAQKTGIRWASTVLAPMTFFSAHEPTLRRHFPALAQLKTLGPLLDRAFIRCARWMTGGWLGPTTQLRDEVGLPRGSNPLFEGQFSPALTLALFSPLFGRPLPDWPPNTIITGFPFYREPVALPPELSAFLDTGPPPVVFTLGSSAWITAGTFFEESLQAVRQLGCRAVLVVGEFASNTLPQPLPPGVAVFPYAPYSELFPRVAVIVHQGGIGTTAEALRSGRPMLVVPFSFDQPDNAARTVNLGAARSVPVRSYNARTATRELEPLLHDPSYAASAAEVGERIRAEDGVGAASDALERLLKK